MKKWLKWLVILIVLGMLLVVAAGVVGHFALKSDLPRQLVDDRIDRMLGLDVRMEALEVGWFGHVTAKGVTAALPLRDEPVLTAPQLEIEVTPLWLAALTGLKVQKIESAGATLAVRQWPDGQWNVQEVLDVLLSRRGGGERTGSAWLELPELELTDLTVAIEPTEGQPVTLTGVSVALEEAGGAGYAVSAAVPGVGAVSGEVSRSGPWRHTMAFELDPQPTVIEAVTGQRWQTLEAKGRWQGAVVGGAVQGDLELTSVRTPWAIASGRVDAEFGATTTLKPDRLEVTPFALDRRFAVSGGSLTYGGEAVTVEGVTVAGYGGQAQVGGRFDPVAGAGELAAVWRGVQLPEMVTHAGRVEVSVRGASERTPLQVTVATRVEGQSPWGAFGGAVSADAGGEQWTQLSATVRTRDLWLDRGGETWRMEDLVANLFGTPERIRLRSVDFASPRGKRSVVAEAVYDVPTQDWRLAATLRHVGEVALGVPLDRVTFRAVREGSVIQLVSAEVEAAMVSARATGQYRLGEEQPLALDINLDQVAVPAGGGLDAPWVESEYFRGRVALEGELLPLQLAGEGGLVAVNVSLGGQAVGDVRLGLRGSVTPEKLEFVASSPELFGSQWSIRTQVGFSPMHLAVGLDALDVQLPVLQQFVPGIPDLAGAMDVSLSAESGRLSLADAALSGSVAIDDLRVGPFVADRLTTQLRSAADEQWLHFDEVKIVREDGQITGQAAIAAERLDRVQAELTLEQWPLLFPDLVVSRVALGGTLDVSFNLADLQGTGAAALTAALSRGDQDLGQVAMQANLSGSTVTLADLSGQLLGGAVSGQARTDLLDLMQSSAEIRWDDLVIARLEEWSGPLRDIAGSVDAWLTLERTDDPRALTPLKLTAGFTAEDAAYGQMTLEEGAAVAFLEPGRFVLQDLSVQAAGGELNVWGRLTMRDDEPHFYADANATSLSLEAITRSFEPVDTAVGSVSARLTLVGRADRWREMTGQGSVRLSNSDLGRIPLFGALFALTNAQLNPEPQGEGGFTFNLADAALRIREFRYRNRGISYRLTFALANLWDYRNSPLDGLAIMSVRPLPDLDFLRAVNELLITIQNDVWAVRISGTWSEPAVGLVPLQGLENTVRTFFGSEYQ